jgi:hypothetical protein
VGEIQGEEGEKITPPAMLRDRISINRAPVLTLWAAIVAERLGFDREEALSLGKAVAGLTAQRKGRRLGIFAPTPEALEKARKEKRVKELWIELLGRHVPAINTPDGIRAVNKAKPVDPGGVERYLEGKFGEALPDVREAMGALVKAFKPDRLAQEAFRLYEEFRPGIPEGVAGWGAKGELDLNRVRALAPKK